jgi:sulfur carrier protein
MKTFNVNQEIIVSQSESLLELLKELHLEQQKGFAVALGDQIIPKSEWEHTILQVDQKIHIIKASQGG